MSKRLLVALVALLLVVLAVPAIAITNGQPDDNNDYPAVGQLLFFDPTYVSPDWDDPGGWFSCSGTLVSDSIVLTAGHCTWGIGEGTFGVANTDGDGGTDMWVTFDQESNFTGFPSSSDYEPDENEDRYDDRVAWLDARAEWRRGTAHPHPQYDDGLFYLYDLGVVVLGSPVSTGDIAEADYGMLPTEGHLDQYFPTKGQKQTFTPVGYGIQEIVPFFQADDERYFASVKLVDVKGVFGVPEGVAVKFSNNSGQPYTGGTCFGDSGGPVFEGNSTLIVAVTSFGLSPNCTGSDGAYRVDQLDDLEWLYETYGLGPDPSPE